jgi:hypothetical protein
MKKSLLKCRFIPAISFGWVILLNWAFQPAYSQNYFSFQTAKGYMLAHSSDLRDIHGWPNIFKLDYAIRLNSKEYHHCLNTPLSGVSLTYMDHDHPATGKSVSLSTFLQPTIRKWGRHEVSGRMSLGLSYVQNPFDPVKNPLQQAIGSNMNFFVEGQLLYAYNLTSNLDIGFNSGLIHISNGARKLPNSGLNILAVGIGANYRITGENHIPFKNVNHPELPYEIDDITHYVNFRGGLKSIRILDYDVFPAFGLNYTMAYRYHPIGSYTIGFDADYNEGYIKEMHAVNRAGNDYTPFSHWRWALAAGHELHMNRLSLITQFAYYVVLPHSLHKRTYQRYGLKYELSRKTVIAATLRAHGARADYMEWTVGRKF